jgi:hypothetical protein
MSLQYVVWRFCNKYAYLVPPLHLLSAFLLSFTDVNNQLSYNAGARLGISEVAMIVYIAFFFNPRAKFCLFTKVCVVFSSFLFILWELGSIINYELYEKLFDRWAFIASIFTTIVLYYQFRTKNKPSKERLMKKH